MVFLTLSTMYTQNKCLVIGPKLIFIKKLKNLNILNQNYPLKPLSF